MQFNQPGGVEHPAHSIQTAEELAALAGQRVWAVRQITRITLDPVGGNPFNFTAGTTSLMLEWQVGPLLKIGSVTPDDYVMTGGGFHLAVAERHEWSDEDRLYCAHWADAHLLRPRLRTLEVSAYLPLHRKVYLQGRFGASAIFANEADAISHRVLLALSGDAIEPTDHTDENLLGITINNAPRDLYYRTGQWALPPTP